MHKELKTYIIQSLLFIVTFLTTTLAGADWMGTNDWTWEGISQGLYFSIPFLGILTVHEFGHYIASRIYKLAVTLPYYIPLYIPIAGAMTIGTLGAFIRIKSPLLSKKMVMDVGVAGPIAGFIMALGVLYYGFTHLPPKEHIYSIHKEYEQFGRDYEKHVYTYEFSRKRDSLNILEFNKLNPKYAIKWEPQKQYESMSMGSNLLLLFFEKYVASDPELIPNKYEIFHYPFIFAGFLALFFTALNLLPLGQLDGGHVTYGLFGSRIHKVVSITGLIVLIYLAGVDFYKGHLMGNIFDNKGELVVDLALYVFFLYFIFSKLTDDWKTNLMIAAIMFAAQFFTVTYIPEFKGISMIYLVFGTMVARFLGVGHPITPIEEDIGLKRKLIGWFALIIFILCFTPELFVEEIVRP